MAPVYTANGAAGATAGPARPHPHAPFHPTSDQATYRDLLLFEERLKMNAEMLRKRRRRYNGKSIIPWRRLFQSTKSSYSFPLDLYRDADDHGIPLVRPTSTSECESLL